MRRRNHVLLENRPGAAPRLPRKAAGANPTPKGSR